MSCPKVVFTKVVDELTHYFLQHIGKSKRFENRYCMVDILVYEILISYIMKY